MKITKQSCINDSFSLFIDKALESLVPIWVIQQEHPNALPITVPDTVPVTVSVLHFHKK